MNEFLFDTDQDDLQDDYTEAVNPEEISDIVLFSTDWTTETILTQLEKGNIDLNPRFQRRDACQGYIQFNDSDNQCGWP